MRLSKRPSVYSLPSYSLTGDLLGFLRCGLQYRYTKIGQLPASNPVQMWFGEFIHGVLEEAYRRYHAARSASKVDLPPWAEPEIKEIRDLIKRRLAARGLFPWSEDLEGLGDRRASTVINDLGPELFPIIHRAEVRLTGARVLPVEKIPARYRFREADRYEMVGVIDVITHVQLSDPALKNNRIVKNILAALPQHPPDKFEVIIDYKGMRRPPINVPSTAGPSYWDIYGWQVSTYGHLRSTHEDSLPVLAGAIFYLNELLPTGRYVSRLRQEIKDGQTDIVPASGSETDKILKAWKEKEKVPILPLDYRIARAMRVVPIDDRGIQKSLRSFDDVVARIETCRGKELQHSKVLSTWEQNPADESTCTACDARTFCPSYESEKAPSLPAIRLKT